jgi:hypothetical protein
MSNGVQNSKSVCHPKFATTNPSITSIFSRLKIIEIIYYIALRHECNLQGVIQEVIRRVTSLKKIMHLHSRNSQG